MSQTQSVLLTEQISKINQCHLEMSSPRKVMYVKLLQLASDKNLKISKAQCDGIILMTVVTW